MDLQALGFHQIFGNEGLYLNTSWNKRKKVGRNVLKEKRIKTCTGDLVCLSNEWIEIREALEKVKDQSTEKIEDYQNN